MTLPLECVWMPQFQMSMLDMENVKVFLMNAWRPKLLNIESSNIVNKLNHSALSQCLCLYLIFCYSPKNVGTPLLPVAIPLSCKNLFFCSLMSLVPFLISFSSEAFSNMSGNSNLTSLGWKRKLNLFSALESDNFRYLLEWHKHI